MPPAILTALFALLTGALFAQSQDAPRLHSAAGPHYDVVSELGEANATDSLALLEAAWPQFVRFFGREPAPTKAKLRVRIYAGPDQLKRGMSEDGSNSASDGIAAYCPTTRTVYVRGIPWILGGRTRMLEEAVTQFRALLQGGDDKTPRWWSIAIREHLGQHAWDGRDLELGIALPVVEDDWRLLKKGSSGVSTLLPQIRAKDFDYRKSLGSYDAADRLLHRAVVRALADDAAYRKKLVTLMQRVQSGDDLRQSAWDKHIGAYPKFAAVLRDSVDEGQEALASGWTSWETVRVDRDPNAGGRRFWLRSNPLNTTATCWARQDATSLTTKVTLPSQKSLGVVIDWVAPNDYRAIVFGPAGHFHVYEATGKSVKHGLAKKPPFTDSQPEVRRLRVERSVAAGKKTMALVLLDGVEVDRIEVRNTRFGLFSERGAVEFAEVQVAF